jgi:glycosyltransferase involved in cell wall biosynthesis
LKTVLQLCQNYHQPFLDCTRQYTALFAGTDYRVVSVFICGVEQESVRQAAAADEVIFLNHHRDELDGLKRHILREIRSICEQYDFSVCIAHRNKATYLALMGTNLPVFSIHHAFGDFDRLGRRLLSRFYQKRLTFFAVSNAVKEDIHSKLPSWPTEKLHTLYNRINRSELSQQLSEREQAREQLGIPQHSYIVANVGRLHPDKDQSTLIRAFAAAREYLPAGSLLLLIGAGKDLPKLEKLCAQLNLSSDVIFTGMVPDARTAFRAFDLFVLSSDHEPFGMVLLEAMIAGVPVICSDSGGGPEVIDGIGSTFPTGDDQALSKAIISASRTQQSDEQIARVNERLALFSDEQARQTFWALPIVRRLLGDASKNSV